MKQMTAISVPVQSGKPTSNCRKVYIQEQNGLYVLLPMMSMFVPFAHSTT